MPDAMLEGELRSCIYELSVVTEELKRLKRWVKLLLSLPPSLQKTLVAINELKVASSYEVAELTGRGNSIEWTNLNHFHKLGYLKKHRKGKRVIYTIIESRPVL